ncbi:hypothetical protein SCLCIDRAFT_1213473 [Scleroderma citrinum Foug A]|uniref:Uncharacterized protein n=1 Tax=Scleroderma citrinum Foug A TaxID=1036808 RepID=A0A0C3E8P3_9AGAM|nr:hypothetical protein SCLCIDRAFT_1213473 [Scleroderma citrinum Foug A]
MSLFLYSANINHYATVCLRFYGGRGTTFSREIVPSVIIICPPFPFNWESRKYEEAAVSLCFRRLYFLSVEFNQSHQYRMLRSLWAGMSSGRNHALETV